MSLNDIPYSIVSLESIVEMANQTKTTINTNLPDDALLGGSIAALANPIEQAVLAIGSSKKQALTEQINGSDRKRGRFFIGFRKHLEADQYNDWNPAVKQAADNILEIVAKHGNRLHDEGQTVQSALLTSLFADLDTDEAKADLTTLGLTEWIVQLKDAQNEFADLFQQRNELESAKNIPTKAVAKAELVEKLSTLLNGLSFLANSQADTYAETAKLVSDITNRIVTSERGR
ncbi:MAG: DUF6261 family protein [Bacteroidota bacterium]